MVTVLANLSLELRFLSDSILDVVKILNSLDVIEQKINSCIVCKSGAEISLSNKMSVVVAIGNLIDLRNIEFS